MLSTGDIAQWANGLICPIIPGVKSFGIGKTASKDDKQMPYADDTYIGIDDTYPSIIYHKELSVASAILPGGFGESVGNLQNTFQMAMIVYFNETKCGLSADKLYMFIQSAITGVLKAEDYKQVRVGVSSAVLNDVQVWRQEYGNAPYKLADAQRLIQINYSIVTVFDNKCITIPKCLN
jgi:hypothetical protein